ncbi:LapA family protein [Paenibacillus lemnae]|uniref:DUF1049 domain-containing protein n=1 Tax=Paenibacillus lemnae TaxID=1330551 RepID=A0A848M5K8_PAELE|nr:lipopolysaccharide assembly protein LapA domain-containing protein [Paenibacillus lemnae]NMO95392.1 DUF1049 domain-containing protein [Paenibacillus lemnae]
MKMQWSLILGLVFALLTAVFAVINVDPVSVNLLFGMVTVPLILLIIGCTLLGGIIVGSYGIYRQYQMQKQIKSLTAQLAQVQEVTGYTPEAVSLDEANHSNEPVLPADTSADPQAPQEPAHELQKDKL